MNQAERQAFADPIVAAEPDNGVRRAMATLHQFRQRRREVVERQAALKQERDEHAYDGAMSPANSPAGRHSQALRRSIADLDAELEELDAAVRGAEQRVGAARDKAAAGQRCKDAQHALDLLEEWQQAAVFANEALLAFTGRYQRVEEISDELFRLNVNAPRGELVRVNVKRAVSSELAPLGLGDLLPPSQRTSIERLIEGWADRVQDRARRILGGEEEAA